MLYFLGFFFLSCGIFDISWAISHDEVRYGMRFLLGENQNQNQENCGTEIG